MLGFIVPVSPRQMGVQGNRVQLNLYYLERACEAQRHAMATGRPLKAVSEEVAARTAAQMREGDGESAKLHLESVKRILAASEPDFST
jgi:hypothetical protein